MRHKSSETRRRIIEAADELFYGEGLKSVGVDAIAARAGVTKRTLYYHFPSKDDLIAGYLEARDGPTLNRYQQWVAQFHGSLSDRIKGIFRQLADHAQNPGWKGCGFARAAAELAGMPGHPALAAASKHKRSFQAWFAELLRAEGVKEPEVVARQLMVLLDGAIMQILIHKDPAYAEAAGQAAIVLIEDSSRVPRMANKTLLETAAF